MKAQALSTEYKNRKQMFPMISNQHTCLISSLYQPKNSPNQILSKVLYLFWLHSLGQASKASIGLSAYMEIKDVFKIEVIWLYEKKLKKCYLELYSAIKIIYPFLLIFSKFEKRKEKDMKMPRIKILLIERLRTRTSRS